MATYIDLQLFMFACWVCGPLFGNRWLVQAVFKSQNREFTVMKQLLLRSLLICAPSLLTSSNQRRDSSCKSFMGNSNYRGGSTLNVNIEAEVSSTAETMKICRVCLQNLII